MVKMIWITTLLIIGSARVSVAESKPQTKPLILPDFSRVQPRDDANLDWRANCVDKDGLPVRQGDRGVKECRTTVSQKGNTTIEATVDESGRPGAGLKLNSGK